MTAGIGKSTLGVLGETSRGALGYCSMSSESEHGRGSAELDKKQQELLDLCAHFFGDSPHVEKVHPPDLNHHRKPLGVLCQETA